MNPGRINSFKETEATRDRHEPRRWRLVKVHEPQSITLCKPSLLTNRFVFCDADDATWLAKAI